MSINKYLCPIKEGDIKDIPTHSSLHVGNLRNSVDFTCNEGTEIVAARGGEVVWIKDDSNVGGLDKKYMNDGNRVVIKHDNGEYTAYEHLKYKGVTVKVGDKVEEGELVGYAGNTGYSSAPHLHFEVFKWTKKNPDPTRDFETVEVSFKRGNGKGLEQKLALVVLFGASLLFLSSNLTGNTISNLSSTTINWFGGVLLAIGLIAAFFYFKRK
ncbi:MAG: M23 family metallopeptidase [archaeon]